MIVSMQYETREYDTIRVDPVKPQYKPTLCDFVVRFGSTNVYMMRDQLLTLLHECETAIHHANDTLTEEV